MNDLTKTSFRPRWQRDASLETKAALADTPATGSRPLEWPKIITRLLPFDGLNTLAAHTLSEVIELTQRLAHYAAFDAIRGFNPDFADMRSMGAEVLAFSKLTIEPFESGSFVIPARLESPDYVENNNNKTSVSAESVGHRFGAILEEVASGETTTSVSIGALQTVQQLNRTLKREANAIEYSTFDRLDCRMSFHVVDRAFIDRVDSVIKKRQPSTQKVDSLEGEVTALDISKGELQLTLTNQRQRVKGTFHLMLHPTLLDALGKRVRLFGTVNYSGRRPASILIQSAEILDAD